MSTARALVTIILLFGVSTVVHAQSPSLTNSDVTRLVAMHVSDLTVIAVIREAKATQFDLKPLVVDDLAFHGVSVGVIAAMRQAAAPPPATDVGAAQSPVPAIETQSALMAAAASAAKRRAAFAETPEGKRQAADAVVVAEKMAALAKAEAKQAAEDRLVALKLAASNAAAKTAAEAAAAQRAQPGPRMTPAEVAAQFSVWNGSHIKLTALIKRGMNDPASFEHVETRYLEMGDHLVVTTKFRGKNAFGGLVLNSVTAKVDRNGNILNIVQ